MTTNLAPLTTEIGALLAKTPAGVSARAATSARVMRTAGVLAASP